MPDRMLTAVEQLTTQVRRIADALTTTAARAVTDAATTRQTDWELAPPPADEEQLRTTRRDSIDVMLSRAARGVLTRDEGALLRPYVEAEMREGDTARRTIERMKRTNRMVNGGARESRERAEKAEAAVERVRQTLDDRPPLATGENQQAASDYEAAWRDLSAVVLAALDDTEQPGTGTD